MSEKIRTQLSSKYSPDNGGLFTFKANLKQADVDVAYPIGDSIIGYDEGFAITTPHEAYLPFYSSEVRFLREVKYNPLQIVYNINAGKDGYMGESTSIETAYAMLLNKPIVLLRQPEISPTVPPEVEAILAKRLDQLPVIPLDKCDIATLPELLLSLINTKPDFQFTNAENDILMSEITKLCRKYLNSWKTYKQAK